MRPQDHVAAAQVAIALATWHARHARHTRARLFDVRQCAASAIHQLQHALETALTTAPANTKGRAA